MARWHGASAFITGRNRCSAEVFRVVPLSDVSDAKAHLQFHRMDVRNFEDASPLGLKSATDGFRRAVRCSATPEAIAGYAIGTPKSRELLPEPPAPGGALAT